MRCGRRAGRAVPSVRAVTPTEPNGLVPGLPRAVVLLGAAAAAVVVIAGMSYASWLLGPVFLALVVVLVISVASVASLLPTYADRANDLVKQVADTLARFGVGPDESKEAGDGSDWNRLADVVES